MKNTLRVLTALSFFGALQGVSIAQSDTTAPKITALSFSSSSVTVSSTAQTVIILATITDDLAGLYYSTVTFTSPSGQQVSAGMNRISGTVLNGNYEGAVTFPALAEPGTWTVTVYLFDLANNDILLSSSQLIALGLPGTITVVDSAPDTTPPTLVSASFSPTSVNTTLFPQNVTVSLHITDAGAGASFNSLINFAVIMAPTNAGSTGPFQYLSQSDFSLASGTTKNGTWTATKTMPLLSGGTWTIIQVILYDAVSNKITLTQSQLNAAGINPTLTVTSISSDTTPPNLTSLTFTPSTINTQLLPATVLVSLAATDDLSGLSFSLTTSALSYMDLYFISPSGLQQVHSTAVPALLLGLPTAGSWQFALIWPLYSESGTWTCFYARINDAVGNTRTYGTSDLISAGINYSLVVDNASSSTDGTVTSTGGTITDSSFGSRATLTFPAGEVSSPTTVAIQVVPSPTSVTTPKGFVATGTYFTNLVFSPALSTPVASPGVSVTLPLVSQMAPGATLSLYHVDAVAGQSPALNASGNPVTGTVDTGGETATFNNVVTFSPLLAFVTTGSVLGDVNGDGLVNCLDVSILKSAFGKHTGQSGFNLAADLNTDGVIDLRDLFIVTHQLPVGTVCH